MANNIDMDMKIVKKLYKSGIDEMVIQSPTDELWYYVYRITRYGNGWIQVRHYAVTDTVPWGAYSGLVDTIVSIREIMET